MHIPAALLALLVAAIPAFAEALKFPPDAKTLRDVPYVTGGHERQKLDLFLPAVGEKRPLLVWIHGGGWEAGSKKDCPALGMVARGFVVASLNYRLSQHAIFPAQIEDCKSAIRWLRAHAADGDLDTTRVAVWGMASGGQLAALAGVTCGVPALEPADLDKDAPSGCVQAVIDWYGATDMKVADKPATGFTLPATSDGGAFLGCEPAACPPGLA
ncbi:MAG: alpha/beta hydrolase, partial [Chthoniobacteraceae bacterium]